MLLYCREPKLSSCAVENSMNCCSQRSSTILCYPSAISRSSNDGFVWLHNGERVKAVSHVVLLQRFNSIFGCAIEKRMIVCSQRSSTVSDYSSAISKSSNDSFVWPDNDEMVKVLSNAAVRKLWRLQRDMKTFCEFHWEPKDHWVSAVMRRNGLSFCNLPNYCSWIQPRWMDDLVLRALWAHLQWSTSISVVMVW